MNKQDGVKYHEYVFWYDQHDIVFDHELTTANFVHPGDMFIVEQQHRMTDAGQVVPVLVLKNILTDKESIQ
tara:strand:- start:806 stop:1018 length:213 start_codon:yes stop_codon:yes gene_type:complete